MKFTTHDYGRITFESPLGQQTPADEQRRRWAVMVLGRLMEFWAIDSWVETDIREHVEHWAKCFAMCQGTISPHNAWRVSWLSTPKGITGTIERQPKE